MKKILFCLAFLLVARESIASQTEVYYIDNSLGETVADPVHRYDVRCENETEAAATLRVNTAQRFQITAGVGAAFSEIGTLAFAGLPEQKRNEIITSLFDPLKGAGFSMCRLPVGASDFATNAYSYAEQSGDFEMGHFSIVRDEKSIIPAVQAALKKNPEIGFFASPWSPPGWMKNTGTMDKGGKTNNLLDREDIYKAYTLYFEKYIRAYGAKGIVVKRLCPQNEMDASTRYPSCVMSPPQMVKLVVDHLAPAFRQDGIQTELWAGTFRENPKTAWAAECLKTPAFRKAISGLGIQYYNRYSIAALTRADPTLRFMFTEASCKRGDNTPVEAQAHFREMMAAFTVGCDSFAYWNMMLDENQKSGWGWRQNSLITIDTKKGMVRYNPDYQPMCLIGRYLKPGDIRIAADFTGLRNGVISSEMAAFRKPDGTVVAFLQNLGSNALMVKIILDDKENMVRLPAHSDSAVLIPSS